MANLTIETPLVDGSLVPYIEPSDTCAQAVEFVCGDDLCPLPVLVRIEVVTETGKTVTVSIPKSPSGLARVTVDGAGL